MDGLSVLWLYTHFTYHKIRKQWSEDYSEHNNNDKKKECRKTYNYNIGKYDCVAELTPDM